MRTWHELVAAVGELVPGGVPALGMLLLGLAAVVAVLWYWWPEWLPAGRRAAGGAGGGSGRGRSGRWWSRPHWPGFGAWWWRWRRWSRWRLRWRWPRWRRRRRAGRDDHADAPPEQLPAMPAAALVLSADELAAQGRFKEAVRERLRAIVRELVEHEVITYRPGWTVTELAGAAGSARPAAAAALAGASDIFSRIWYGQREALASHDAAMREHAAQVRAVLARSQPERVGG